MVPGLYSMCHYNDDDSHVVTVKMPSDEGELRDLMMAMKKSYFNGFDHTLNHDDLYTLLSWMEDIILDSVKKAEVPEKRRKSRWNKK